MNQIQQNLDQTLSVFEQGLNVAGYIPVVSTFSGALRVSYGKLEIMTAIAAASLLAIKALFNSNESERNAELNKAVEVLFSYSLHGAANITRGIIESFPFVSLATCLPYDLMGYRFSYSKEGPQLLKIGEYTPLFSA